MFWLIVKAVPILICLFFQTFLYLMSIDTERQTDRNSYDKINIQLLCQKGSTSIFSSCFVLFVCLFVCFLSLIYYLFNFKMSHLQCVLKMYFYRGFSGYSIYRSLHINKCTDYFRYLDGIT